MDSASASNVPSTVRLCRVSRVAGSNILKFGEVLFVGGLRPPNRRVLLDLAILCDDGGTVWVNHAIIPALRSGFLRDIVADHTGCEIRIILPGVRAEILKKVFELVYLGQTSVYDSVKTIFEIKEVLRLLRMDVVPELEQVRVVCPPDEGEGEDDDYDGDVQLLGPPPEEEEREEEPHPPTATAAAGVDGVVGGKRPKKITDLLQGRQGRCSSSSINIERFGGRRMTRKATTAVSAAKAARSNHQEEEEAATVGGRSMQAMASNSVEQAGQSGRSSTVQDPGAAEEEVGGGAGRRPGRPKRRRSRTADAEEAHEFTAGIAKAVAAGIAKAAADVAAAEGAAAAEAPRVVDGQNDEGAVYGAAAGERQPHEVCQFPNCAAKLAGKQYGVKMRHLTTHYRERIVEKFLKPGGGSPGTKCPFCGKVMEDGMLYQHVGLTHCKVFEMLSDEDRDRARIWRGEECRRR